MKTSLKNIFLTLLVSCSFCACEFEPYELREGEELIQQESVLYNYLQLVSDDPEAELIDIGCVEFIYPFVLFVYDTEQEFVQQESVLNNKNFTKLLAGLEEGHAISLSYPITGMLQDGSTLNITSNDELQASLETCIEEELEIILGACNAIAAECQWNVSESSVVDSPYLEAFFTMEDDGSILFQIGENEYNGTWVFYFIEELLHLNIYFEYDDDTQPLPENELLPIKDDWNYDWKITYIDEIKISIENDNGDTYTLNRICAEETDDPEN
ncbi:MAG: hypothetical protein WBG90_02630 [Saonia sp.]